MNWNKILTRLTRSVYDRNHRERKCIAYEDPVPNFLFDFLHLGSIHNFYQPTKIAIEMLPGAPGGSTGRGPIAKKQFSQSFESNKANQDPSDMNSTILLYTQFINEAFKSCDRPNHVRTKNRKIKKIGTLLQKIDKTVKRWLDKNGQLR